MQRSTSILGTFYPLTSPHRIWDQHMMKFGRLKWQMCWYFLYKKSNDKDFSSYSTHEWYIKWKVRYCGSHTKSYLVASCFHRATNLFYSQKYQFGPVTVLQPYCDQGPVMIQTNFKSLFFHWNIAHNKF